jgi:hypothetical protein
MVRYLWAQDNLDALLLFVPEDLIAVRCVIQAQAMRDDKRRINIALLNAPEQGAQISVHVRLTHFQG